mgnify:CR=1 FL=1
MKAGIGIAAASIFVGLAATNPAYAAGCTYKYDQNGFPQWSSSCRTVMSPGRIGPLTMGKTTVAQARERNYLAKNTFCGDRLDGVLAYNNWRRRDGKLAAWTGGGTREAAVTSKGLKSSDSLSRARRLYPALDRTGFLANPYIPGEGWRIYSVRAKRGWLDLYLYAGKGQANFFAVRAFSVKEPITDWSLDGC